MHGEVLQADVDDQAEDEAEQADEEAPLEEPLPGDGAVEEGDRAEVGEDEVGLALGLGRVTGGGGNALRMGGGDADEKHRQDQHAHSPRLHKNLREFFPVRFAPQTPGAARFGRRIVTE